MKSFAFRLDRVLDYRNYLEKRALKDLYNARHECKIMEREIKRLVEEKVKTANECTDKELRGINVPEYQIYQVFLGKLDSDLEKTHINLKEGEQKVIEREETLKKKTIKKKTLVALKEVQYENYMENLAREEQKVLDEIAILKRGQRS
jgi:flagellar FliJ protein